MIQKRRIPAGGGRAAPAERVPADPCATLLPGPDGGLGPAEIRQATEKLYQLLREQARRYSMGDHTSLPVEVAEELLRSIVFTLEQGGCVGRALSEADLGRAFRKGRFFVEALTARTKRLYERVCQETPDLENRALADTLRSIGGFFRRYDKDFFAHQIPCSVDYQLCSPVEEGAQGAAYIEGYLKRLSQENRIIRLFPLEEVKRLLTSWRFDYREMVNNLCEPVLTNALGRAVLDMQAPGGAPGTPGLDLCLIHI